jgi:serine/threonine-protein kinase RsbW
MFGRTLARSPLEFFHVSMSARTWRYRVLNTTAEMSPFLKELVAALEVAGFPREDVFAVRLALEEAIVNAIRHGNGGDNTKQVHLRYCVTDDCLLAEVQDEGKGFSYAAVAGRPGVDRGGQDHGRGLELMMQYMTWVEHNEPGNCVTLCKYRSPARAPGGQSAKVPVTPAFGQ